MADLSDEYDPMNTTQSIRIRYFMGPNAIVVKK